MKIESFDTPLPQEILDAVQAAFDEAEREVGQPCSVSLNFVSAEEIHALNREFRAVDRITDVLSFPNYDLNGLLRDELSEIDAEWEDGRLFLGDIAINATRAQEQARELGHGFKREVVFLALHGLLHLLGYDHITAQDEQKMTARQAEILEAIGVNREPDES